MKKLNALIAGPVLALLSPVVLAHAGHGLEGAPHALVHMVWLFDAVLVLVVALALRAGRARDRR